MTKKTAQTKKKVKKKGKKKMDMTELKKLKDEYEKTLREKGQEIMKGAIEQFFKANPKITGVTWTQYTPYFNDGDTCEFGVNDPAFSVTKVNVENVAGDCEDGEGGFFNRYGFNLYSDSDVKKYGDWAVEHNRAVQASLDAAGSDESVFVNAQSSFDQTIGVAPEDLFLAAFGDHTKVVITPDEIYTEEYEHD